MGLFDRLKGIGTHQWQWLDIGKVTAEEFGDKMWNAAEKAARVRGLKVGTIMPIHDPSGFLGMNDDEIKNFAQEIVMKGKSQLAKEDQSAISRGDVCIVAAHQWAKSKQGNEAWIRLVGVVSLH